MGPAGTAAAIMIVNAMNIGTVNHRAQLGRLGDAAGYWRFVPTKQIQPYDPAAKILCFLVIDLAHVTSL